ncbi:putative flippase GtrA [Geodermatophilus bullaregiensis]|uniref:GtrA family protein n=1 Tax=Geodermatophilus bullaregiensis TaxID=1564160 RepID=UPI00195DE980|nr:GtrA family protein [Geodermatophilus bullaregiensis]MBM7805829.1 putative flippase GtrA [Geodermatophilus bullaregiensis]
MPFLPAVRRRAGTTWRLLLKELSAFGVVGSACFVLDLGLFQVLYAHLGVGAVTAKFLSTVVSMTVAYFAHRHWSFSHRARTGLRREYSIFVAVNGLTLALGLALVALVRYPLGQEGALVLQATNIASTALGTVIRFLAYRRWVFVAPDHPAAVSADRSAVPATADPAVRPAGREPGRGYGVAGSAVPGR